MPEHTAFTVCNGSVLCGFNSFSYRKILMVAGKNFECIDTLIRETNKVLYNIEQSFFLEHTLKESVKLSILCVFIVAVFGFPLHKTVFTGGDRTRFGGQLVAHNTDSVVNEHRRDFLHIVTELPVRFGSVRFFTGRRFKFNQYNRQTIQKENYIGAFIAVLNKSPLVSYDKGVIVGIFVVNKIDDRGTLLAANKKSYRNTVLQIVHKNGVFLHKLSVFKVFQLEQSVLNGVIRQTSVQTIQRVKQNLLI